MKASRSRAILLPPIAAVPPLPITLAGLLPNRNHNEDLYQALAGTARVGRSWPTRSGDPVPPPDEGHFTIVRFTAGEPAPGALAAPLPTDPLVGILAADPFLHVQRLAKRLTATSHRHVINLPSVTQYGREALENMDRLGLGPERELAILRQFATLGFHVSFALTHPEQIAAALALKPVNIIVAPCFDGLDGGHVDTGALLALWTAVRAACRQAGTGVKAGVIELDASSGA